MRRPALSHLAVGSVAAVALSLSAAAPSLADETTSTPSASETEAAAETQPPADPTAPVEATTTDESDSSTTTTETEGTETGVEAETGTETEAPVVETTPTATPSATPTIGGNGAYSYPFVLTSGEDGASTVAIEVAGSGVSVGYTVDEKGKVTDALVVAGAATLVKTTPHTIFLVLESGESVKVKVHGDAVRVKVKPVKGGPLRPGISTPEEVAEDEAAAAEAEEAEAAEVEESEKAKPAKEKKAKKQGKAKKAKKAKKVRS